MHYGGVAGSHAAPAMDQIAIGEIARSGNPSMTSSRSRHLLLVLCGLIFFAYLVYRGGWTLNLTSPYAIFASLLLYLSECYAIAMFYLYVVQVWSPVEPPPLPVLEGRSIDVLIPTYNEDPQILRPTILACLALDYPHRTIVLDDGRRSEISDLCQELGCEYLTRPDNRFAKAGNVNHALEQTSGEFVVILDADHVPERNFLTRILGYFRDERLAFVQTPHAFYNFDSFQAMVDRKRGQYWEEGEIFYKVIEPGRNRWDAAAFAGSAAMFRRKALAEVGYLAVETITEDLHTGMRLHAKGWKSLAISERLICGQAAPDVTTFHTQRLRWGEGNLSILAYDNPLTMRGLTLAQRLCYLGIILFWSGGFALLGIYLTPILMLFTGVPPIDEFSSGVVFAVIIYMLAGFVASRISSFGYGTFWNTQVLGMASFWTQIRATLRAIFRRRQQKFVVTSKRGRQSKSIWRFVWPQVWLLILCLLAVAWGWAKPITGVSDDYLKPMVATGWCLFHAWLAWTVIQRALWIEHPRYGYRHAVCLPIAYRRLDETSPAAESRFGITTDLSSGGAAVVAYEALPVGSRVALTIRGGGEVIESVGVVRWAKHLRQDLPPVELGAEGDAIRARLGLPSTTAAPAATWQLDGYRYGIEFETLPPPASDALDRLCLQYGVPRSYREFEAQRQSKGFFARRFARWLRREQRGEERLDFHLPVMIEAAGDPPYQLYTVTEDLSRSAIAVLADRPLPNSARECLFTILVPHDSISGTASITRHDPLELAGQPYHRYVFSFQHFAGQGRGGIQSLLSDDLRALVAPVLQPEQDARPIAARWPVFYGVAAIVALTLGEFGLFKYVYSDDLFLHRIAVSTTPLDAAEQVQLDRIAADTLAQGYPATDRLVLLAQALHSGQRSPQRVATLSRLLERLPGNIGLSFAQAEALTNAGQYSAAESLYLQLLQATEQPGLAVSQSDVQLAAARAKVRAGQLEAAAPMLESWLEAADPADSHTLRVRDELAGVLARLGKYAEARKVFEGLSLDRPSRILLATIDLLAGDYPAAEKACRALLAETPDDPPVQLLLADVLHRQARDPQSHAILETLLARHPHDAEVRLEIAQHALQNQSYDQALTFFDSLLTGPQASLAVWKGWIDAASSALSVQGIRPASAERARALAGEYGTRQEAAYVGRLAWVFQRLQKLDEAEALLESALKLTPDDATLHAQFLGLLLARDQLDAAIAFIEAHPHELAIQRALPGVYLAQQQFDAAEAACRKILEIWPEDRPTATVLASVLSWQQKYAESLKILAWLRKAEPQNDALAFQTAEVLVWSKDYLAAVQLLIPLAAAHPDEPRWTTALVNAAAGAERLAPNQRAVLAAIAEREAQRSTLEPLIAARLAWSLWREGEAALAKQTADRILSEHPTAPELKKELAGTLAAMGRHREAIGLLTGLPLSTQEELNLAQLYAADKDFAAAAKLCREILTKTPHLEAAELLLADVLSWDQQYDASLEVLARLQAEDAASTAVTERLAQVNLWKGDLVAAANYYHRLLVATPERKELWPGFIDAVAGAEPFDAAWKPALDSIYNVVSKQRPIDPRLVSQLAHAMRRAGEPAQQIALLQAALAADPKSTAIKLQLADALHDAGRFAEADVLYKELLTAGVKSTKPAGGAAASPAPQKK